MNIIIRPIFSALGYILFDVKKKANKAHNKLLYWDMTINNRLLICSVLILANS